MSINLKELFGKKEQPVDLMATPTGQGSGGKRVNGLPSLIVVFFVLLAVGGIAYVTHLRSQNKIVPGATQPLDQKKEGRSASQMANEATSKWLSGIIPSDAQPGRGLPDMPDVQETKKQMRRSLLRIRSAMPMQNFPFPSILISRIVSASVNVARRHLRPHYKAKWAYKCPNCEVARQRQET
ncbi:hypothetical protein [Bilophila wadsworthia]|uniref:hypothetical protein n=1 Tax=Bilophila wadsworthia TaxID=35833 RepID=UPI001D557D72|nr:hypothetical protein [Bilophila wadsworthia]MBS5377456.1 hypothetical protein [Bilophila wadsworthia]